LAQVVQDDMTPPLVWQLPLRTVAAPEGPPPSKAGGGEANGPQCLRAREGRFVKAAENGGVENRDTSGQRRKKPAPSSRSPQGVIFFPLAPAAPAKQDRGASLRSTNGHPDAGSLEILWEHPAARALHEPRFGKAGLSTQSSVLVLPRLAASQQEGKSPDEAECSDVPIAVETRQSLGGRPSGQSPRLPPVHGARMDNGASAVSVIDHNASAASLDIAPGILDALIDPSDAVCSIWRGQDVAVALEEKRERLRLTALHRYESAKAFGKASRRKARIHSQRLREQERAIRVEAVGEGCEHNERLSEGATPSARLGPSRAGSALPPLSRLPTSTSEGNLGEGLGARGLGDLSIQGSKNPAVGSPSASKASDSRSILMRLKAKIDRRSRARMIRSLRKKRRRQLEELHRQALLHEADLDEDIENTNHVGHRRGGRPRESVWADVFAKMQADNKLHHDDAIRALELAGFTSISTELVEEVFTRTTQFVSLGEDDFMKFCEAFDDRLHTAYADAFQRWDADVSGFLDVDELAELFRSFGIEPMKHVLLEVVEEVDDDGSTNVNLEEFSKVVDILIGRQGFSLREYDNFLDIFNRFDRDGSDSMDSKELKNALAWLGFIFSEERVASILDEVDVNRSGHLDQREFLICMRKVQHMEIQIIKDAIRSTDQDGDCSTITKQEVPLVFKALGYFPEAEAVAEAATDAGLDLEESDMDLSGFWKLLTAYRGKEGFGVKDIAEITEAFQHFDKNNSGEINTSDVPRTMRWVGCPMDVEALQLLIYKVNPDGSGKIDMHQLQKLFRMQHEQDMDRAKQLFNSFAAGGDMITATQVVAALEEMELVGKGNYLEQNQQGLPEQLTLQMFLHEVTVAKRILRESQRACSGFTPEEIKDLQQCFRSFDKDNNGEIGELELIQLIEVMFPDMAHNASMRGTLVQLLKDIDADGSGTVDFQDFLRLTSRLCEMQDAERHEREQRVIAQIGFTQDEVADFRLLFMSSEYSSQGGLRIAGARSMIHAITPLGDVLAAQFIEIFHSITTPNRNGRSNDRGIDEVDFPEFLQLMWKLLDMDFAKIKSKSAKSAVAAK